MRVFDTLKKEVEDDFFYSYVYLVCLGSNILKHLFIHLKWDVRDCTYMFFLKNCSVYS